MNYDMQGAQRQHERSVPEINGSTFTDYDRIAPNYDSIRVCVGAVELADSLSQQFTELPTNQTSAVGASVCCGSGSMEEAAFRILTAGGQALPTLHLLDGSQQMLTRAAKRLEEFDALGEAHHYDVREPLPFASDSLHFIMTSQALQHLEMDDSFPHVKALIREIHRVLEANGTCHIITSFPDQISKAQWPAQILSEVLAPDQDPGQILARKYPPQTVLLETLKQSGFALELEQPLPGPYIIETLWLAPELFLEDPWKSKIEAGFSFFQLIEQLGKRELYFRTLADLVVSRKIENIMEQCEKYRAEHGAATLIRARKS